MGFLAAVRACIDRYAVFHGRARRAEYWWWSLFCLLGTIGAAILDAILFGRIDGLTGEIYGPSVLGGMFALAVLLPSLAVTIRRLHDVGRSGWWLLIVLVPVLGALVLLYWMVRRGDTGWNAHGDDPISGPAVAAHAPWGRRG
jgi:uncharacterized membrane protein YhaH (DUF805 family)